MKTERKALFLAILIVILVAVISFISARVFLATTISPNKSVSPDYSSLPSMTRTTLAKFDGSDPTLPIYLALDGYVYDVTLGKKFYQSGAVYHYLAGKDSSATLHIMGGDMIKAKYTIIAILQAN